jgi:threonine/homoserine/homoserine lactone efflux protein
MTLDWWIVLFLAAVAISLTPGPNALLALDHGARFGLRRAGWTVIGAVVGMTALVGAAMAGLGALLLASEALFTTVKWIGAGYLVWLGIQLWRAQGFAGHAPAAAPGSMAPAISRSRAFGTGAAVMLSNPKTILFFTTFLPQFMLPGVPLWSQFAVVAATIAAVELGVEVVLAASAGRLAPWLARHGRTFNRITGGAFIGIGAMVAIAPRA